MNKNKTQKIESFQALRAIAFLGVLTSHSSIAALGAWGVSIFFVMSGFLMMYTYKDRELNSSLKECFKFGINKIKKLYPLHIIMMIINLILCIIELGEAYSLGWLYIYARQVLANIFLIQSWIPKERIYYSLNGVAWYLSTCLFLYITFPLLLKQLKKLNLKKSILIPIIVYVIAIFYVIAVRHYFNPDVNTDTEQYVVWATYIVPIFRMMDFYIGCCLGFIFLNYEKKPITPVATVLEIVAIIATIITDYAFIKRISPLGLSGIRDTIIFLPVAVLLVYLFATGSGLFVKILSNKLFIYIGNISAYLFLIHQVILKGLRLLNTKTSLSINKYYRCILALIISVLLAELYKMVEQRIKHKIRLN